MIVESYKLSVVQHEQLVDLMMAAFCKSTFRAFHCVTDDYVNHLTKDMTTLVYLQDDDVRGYVSFNSKVHVAVFIMHAEHGYLEDTVSAATDYCRDVLKSKYLKIPPQFDGIDLSFCEGLGFSTRTVTDDAVEYSIAFDA